MNTKYTFSESTVAEFYGRQFYAILRADGTTAAYSERVFEIPEEVSFPGNNTPLIFKKAILKGGVIRGGVIWAGVIWGGVIWGGVIRGGEIWGGVIWGGEIRGGVIWGGEIWGGAIWGGVIRGGAIWGGEIRGGEIWGGAIWGGEIRGGEIRKNLLQIQGSRHYCYATPSKDGTRIELGIGCKIYPISDWQENFRDIGESEGYSEEEIAEYGEYIALFASRYPAA